MSSLIPLSGAPLCWGQSWRLGFLEGVPGQRLLPRRNQRGLGSGVTAAVARTAPLLSLGAGETEEGVGLWGAGAAAQQRECWDLSSWGWGEAGVGDLGQEGQAELAPALPV